MNVYACKTCQENHVFFYPNTIPSTKSNDSPIAVPWYNRQGMWDNVFGSLIVSIIVGASVLVAGCPIVRQVVKDEVGRQLTKDPANVDGVK